MSDRYGMLSGVPRWDGKTFEQRFWERVDKSGECWLWTGATFRRGYGAVKREGKQLKAHRVAWEMHFGRLPQGALIMHHCDNPPCVRPQHLFPGTPADNMADKVTKGRQATGDRITAHRTVLRGDQHPSHRHPERFRNEWRRKGDARLAEQAKALYAQGRSKLSIAKSLGIGWATVARILNGTHWTARAA
jgi:hypothetical protein